MLLVSFRCVTLHKKYLGNVGQFSDFDVLHRTVITKLEKWLNVHLVILKVSVRNLISKIGNQNICCFFKPNKNLKMYNSYTVYTKTKHRV